jgi:hypothetical protein
MDNTTTSPRVRKGISKHGDDTGIKSTPPHLPEGTRKGMPTIHDQMASQAHLLRLEAVFFLAMISGKIVALVAIVALVTIVAVVSHSFIHHDPV